MPIISLRSSKNVSPCKNLMKYTIKVRFKPDFDFFHEAKVFLRIPGRECLDRKTVSSFDAGWFVVLEVKVFHDEQGFVRRRPDIRIGIVQKIGSSKDM